MQLALINIVTTETLTNNKFAINFRILGSKEMGEKRNRNRHLVVDLNNSHT